jgi:hypothetical protein
VPALRLPGGRALALIAPAPGAALEAPAGYELRVAPARVSAADEVEPNDDPAHAIALAPGAALRGTISGRADRDFVRVDATETLVIRATGAAPIAVRIAREGTAALVVAPGDSASIAPAVLGGSYSAAEALVEVFAPDPEVTSGARYELRSEARR